MNPFNSTKPHHLFVGHGKLLDEIVQGFVDGRSYALLGGRRCGKTSVLLEIKERIEKKGRLSPHSPIPAYLDIQGLGSVTRATLFQKIYELTTADLTAEPWRPPEHGREYEHFLAQMKAATSSLEKHYGPNWLVVLLVDELDAAIEHLQGDSTFFSNIRNLLMVSVFASHFRIVASGVTELTGLVSSASSPLNNLITKSVGILPREDARKLVLHGGAALLGGEFETALFQLTGCHPYLTQAILEKLELDPKPPITELPNAARKFKKESRTLRKWWVGFGAAEQAVYRALATSANNQLSFQELKKSVAKEFRPSVDDALAILSFHGIINDVDPDKPSIAGTLFRDWFLENDVAAGALDSEVREDKIAPIFISYSHKDQRLFDEFKIMLAPAVRAGLDLWDDTMIGTGQKWREEIERSISVTKIAVLLVSPNFLNSDFIVKKELPNFLAAAGKRGARIFWVYLSECLYQRTPIAEYQAAHTPLTPLDALPKAKRQKAIKDICDKLVNEHQKLGGSGGS